MKTDQHVSRSRLRIALVTVYATLICIVGRLFYWQVIKGSSLQAAASEQYERTVIQTGRRGSIFTSDGSLLVGNETVYRVFVEPHNLALEPNQVKSLLVPLVLEGNEEYLVASSAAQKDELVKKIEQELDEKLKDTSSKRIRLFNRISQATKTKLSELKLQGISFDPYLIRAYPEASMAAHITGFVGKNDQGEDLGYFGIEGALNRELMSRTSTQQVMKDALGFHFLDSLSLAPPQDGRDLVLTIDRSVQHIIEAQLKKGIEAYGAKSGEIIVMEPATGKILGMASWPQYEQVKFYETEANLYPNPSVHHLYEPGSTFKVLTVAAGIDAGVIKPDTVCPVCEGPRQVDKYTIKTWNNEYHPNITMTEALAKSDNTAMMYISDLLGKEKMVQYIEDFQISKRTTFDLQEDSDTPFPSKWGPVEVATRSFGQGISTTSLQMVRAIGAIANNGLMMQPYLVEKAIDPVTKDELVTEPTPIKQVISEETAKIVTKMMVEAAHSGEAQWITGRDTLVAGKTGTSQVAVDGKYDPDKTIASFIGFSTPEDPKFVMLVKLVEPQSSPWAAETAVPLWYTVAKQLYLVLGVAE